MGFTTTCFIRKNTKELRTKLEELGYCEIYVSAEDGLYNNLKTGTDMTGNICRYMQWCQTKITSGIDCGTNEELFLAIAALRDDSDINQYFINDVRLGSINYPESIIPKGSLIKCLIDEWNFPKNYFDSIGIPSHKATIEELIEHFK